jgi:hypothetical protein
VLTTCPRDLNVSHSKKAQKGKQWREECTSYTRTTKLYKYNRWSQTINGGRNSQTFIPPLKGTKAFLSFFLPAPHSYQLKIYL